jgi:hypothetical protein
MKKNDMDLVVRASKASAPGRSTFQVLAGQVAQGTERRKRPGADKKMEDRRYAWKNKRRGGKDTRQTSLCYVHP